jgi:N-formylglutamate amidohydrolase
MVFCLQSSLSQDKCGESTGLTGLFEPPFEVLAPAEQIVPFVLNTPHSGRHYPACFLAQSRLDRHALRRSEDCFVDLLIAEAPSIGAPLLMAHFPRAYLDVNREPYELDPRMFEGRLPAFANTRSTRVAGGLGSIPRIVGDGQEIYHRRLQVSEALQRIDGLYRPYHRALRGLMQLTQRRFGHAILFDCHSMPSASLGDGPRPDIVLGDRYGTSCDPRLIDVTQQAFEERGYSVARNRPYAGGFITEHYGHPVSGNHALQIEINRALYIDEETLRPTAGFALLKDDLTALFRILGAALAGPGSITAQAAFRQAAE